MAINIFKFSRTNKILYRIAIGLSLLTTLLTSSVFAQNIGIWTFDEGTGWIASDRSGQNNHATLTNSVAWIEGRKGLALSFSNNVQADIDRVLVASSTVLEPISAISISVWVRPKGLGSQVIVKKGRDGISNGYEIGLSNTGKVFARFNQASAGDTYRVDSLSAYPTNGNTWMHVSATFDGVTIRLYINGAFESSNTATGLLIGTNTNPLSFGAQDDGARPFIGVMDEMYLHNTAISAAEVLALASASGPSGPRFTLDHFWQLDEPLGSTSFTDSIAAISATCTSCPAPVTGVVNLAKQFDGTSHTVSVADNPSFDWLGNQSFSIELWLNKSTSCAGRQVMLGRKDGATSLDWWLGCEAGKARFHLADVDGIAPVSDLISARGITDGAWHHVAVVRDAELRELVLYVDGIREDSKTYDTTAGFSGNTALTIGWINDVSINLFSGILDEIALHRGVLPPNIIAQHHNDGTYGLHRGYQPCGADYLVMPLGDSITFGSGGSTSGGYRKPLYLNLVDNGLMVNLVGGRADGTTTYDDDHEGWSGYSPTDINAHLASWLLLNPPEVILLHIGTNGLSLTNVNVVETILNTIDTFDPNITVVIAKIINQNPFNTLVTTYNDAIVAMVQSRISNGDKLLIVDQENALTYPDHLSDNLHPNTTGYLLMSRVWQDGLFTFLASCDADRDGVGDVADGFPYNPAESQDFDRDGIGDNADLDDDNDGMPDSWELQWGFNPLNPADTSQDADGDGISNLNEYLAGTSPVDEKEAGSWLLDEGSGLIASDNSGSGNNGSINGSPTWVSGVSGSALQFAGSTDRVLVPNSPSLAFGAAMSVTAWIKPSQVNTQYIVKKARAGSVNGFELGLSKTGGTAFFRINQVSSANTYRIDTNSTYPTNGSTWMHLAATYDGAVLKIYVNGVMETSLTAAGLNIGQNTLPLSIGAQDDGVSPFKGVIDDVRVFNHAISSTRISALAAVGAAPDADGDGVPDAVDRFPNDPLEWADNDLDGLGDNADTDDDNDGMPDSWELQWGFNPLNAADATQDADGDGASNFAEYLAGTTPIAQGEVGRWLLDEGAGPVAADSSGSGNNGTLSGSPSWVPGVGAGFALKFNGGADRLLVPDAASLDLSTTMSIAAWIAPSQINTQYIVKKARSGSVNGFELGLSKTGNTAFFRLNQVSSANTYRIDTNSTYPTNGSTWMHLAATYDGAVLKIYVNGVMETSLVAAGLNIGQNTLPLSIGAQDDGVSPFKGAIDSVHVYEYALTQGEITSLAAAGAAADTDGDGVPDSVDRFPSDPLEWADNDLDGVGDNADTDDDNDGMPDSWEILWRFNPLNAADATEDADGDGVSNLNEYLAGTTPVLQGEVGRWLLDEGAGRMVMDASGFSNNGSLNGNPTWVTGALPGSVGLRFNGGADRILMPDTASLDLSTAMSVAAWIAPSQVNTQYIVKKARSGSVNGFELGLSKTGGTAFFRLNQASSANTYRIDTSSSYPTNGSTWMHLAATYDGAVLKIYVNGVMESSLAAGLSIGQNTLPLSIGAQDDGVSPFKGAIDAVHVYEYALTQSEINNLLVGQ